MMNSATAGAEVGFIGAGQLGEPTVGRLLDAGWPVLLYARRPQVRERLAQRGARVATTLAEVGRESDVLVVFVFSDDQLREVALGEHGALAAMQPGSVLLAHTTASIATMEALADEAAPLGVHVVDAPVSGTAQDIRAGRLTVLLGGADAAAKRCDEIVRAYADPVVRIGPFGAAMKVKLINNILFAANVQLAGDAARLAAQLGIDPMRTLRALMSCSSASTAMGHMARAGDVGAFGQQIATYLRKDVAACAQTAAQLSVDLGLLADVARNGPLDIASA
jgi:3-hydroxyisobutyrate dehydrogenase-like beta-hydroxyacid dehydrogenase